MAEILNRGMMLITQNLALNVATHIDKMVLAYKPGLNYTDPVNPDEPDPAPGEIKYRGPVTKAAAISPDKVVYSLLLEPTVGPFTFNWMGLEASDGTLVAVSYLPDTVKVAKDANQPGDTLIRNFILAFARASAALDVTITPETWQFDFTDYIQAEIAKMWLTTPVNGPLDILRGGHYRFMAPAVVTLADSIPNDSVVCCMVDHCVDLTVSACTVTHSTPISTPKGEDTHINIIEAGREFQFVKINGHWRVS
ncbi:permease [Aeromonas salmonicida subsp. achromogenes]|uniref:phage tail-collar fiber domain-containing protein n=1 Tax=Aeromonas salmonicida TaxID=645 RepID=UPI0002FA8978|nr:phage tail protein [Aeromonas salmonicida]TMX14225.1 permease [Aeromonas salmonicida subsp. achromogenes]TMX15631.1 permease [Aeromonas salmonicida subsp. achromogenes]TMX18647.1 permease [Aeromonas salmonicida subsp. achromogenes]TMX21290.1 permease [Aeromonas salmonicida subsp. achromogenes]